MRTIVHELKSGILISIPKILWFLAHWFSELLCKPNGFFFQELVGSYQWYILHHLQKQVPSQLDVVIFLHNLFLVDLMCISAVNLLENKNLSIKHLCTICMLKEPKIKIIKSHFLNLVQGYTWLPYTKRLTSRIKWCFQHMAIRLQQDEILEFHWLLIGI